MFLNRENDFEQIKHFEEKNNEISNFIVFSFKVFNLFEIIFPTFGTKVMVKTLVPDIIIILVPPLALRATISSRTTVFMVGNANKTRNSKVSRFVTSNLRKDMGQFLLQNCGQSLSPRFLVSGTHPLATTQISGMCNRSNLSVMLARMGICSIVIAPCSAF